MTNTAPRRSFGILLTATANAVVRENSNNKRFVTVRGTLKNNAERTVMTYVPKVVEQIGSLKAGETVRLLGDFRRDNGALTFSATAVLPLEGGKKAAPAQSPAAEEVLPAAVEAPAPEAAEAAPAEVPADEPAPEAPKARRKRASRSKRAQADTEQAAVELPLAA